MYCMCKYTVCINVQSGLAQHLCSEPIYQSLFLDTILLHPDNDYAMCDNIMESSLEKNVCMCVWGARVQSHCCWVMSPFCSVQAIIS